MTLPMHPTKEQEIQHLSDFVDALPKASYLADIMPDVLRAVTNAIRNDIGHVPIDQILNDFSPPWLQTLENWVEYAKKVHATALERTKADENFSETLEG